MPKSRMAVPRVPAARIAPRGLDAVADETRAERRDQHGAHAVAPVGNLVRLRVDEQRLADIEPGQRDVFAVRFDVFGPEVARIAGLGKLRISTGDRRVGKFGIEHALHGRLQPPRHRDVVGVDAPAPFRQFAFQIEHVAGAGRRKDDPPVARLRRVRLAVLVAQADKGVFAGQDRFVGIGNAHGYWSSLAVEVVDRQFLHPGDCPGRIAPLTLSARLDPTPVPDLIPHRYLE